jgi:RsiW-degrading membrane proteinase PrsW (M82 family)
MSKDMHPEPKKTILRIFLWGALSTIPVFFVQIGLMVLLAKADLDPLTTSIIYWFLVISLTEEFFKYLIVRLKVQNSKDMDEPLDIMLYMVVSALGFAALENILYLFTPASGLSLNQLLQQTVIVSFIRFVGATFLHTLCSAVIGYFMALSFFHPKRSMLYMPLGFFIAVLLHGLFDFSIIKIEGYEVLVIPGLLLLIVGFLTFLGFERLKKIKSVSIIK